MLSTFHPIVNFPLLEILNLNASFPPYLGCVVYAFARLNFSSIAFGFNA
jgi:hypothetical protein